MPSDSMTLAALSLSCVHFPSSPLKKVRPKLLSTCSSLVVLVLGNQTRTDDAQRHDFDFDHPPSSTLDRGVYLVDPYLRDSSVHWRTIMDRASPEAAAHVFVAAAAIVVLADTVLVLLLQVDDAVVPVAVVVALQWRFYALPAPPAIPFAAAFVVAVPIEPAPRARRVAFVAGIAVLAPWSWEVEVGSSRHVR